MSISLNLPHPNSKKQSLTTILIFDAIRTHRKWDELDTRLINAYFLVWLRNDGKGTKKPVAGKAGQADKQQQPKPTFTTVKSPPQGNKTSFFLDTLNDTTANEGTKVIFVFSINDDLLSQDNCPKYFVLYQDDEKLNAENEFYTKKNESGSDCRVFKTENDNIQIIFNIEIGQIKITFDEARSSNKGKYKLVGLNDVGDFDEISCTLHIASEYI